jgi:hypothetical protein
LAVAVSGGLLAANAAVAAPVDLISNGSFESGFSGWTQTTSLARPYCAWAINSCFTGLTPPDGSHYATNGFDGSGPGTYTLAQTVTIPTGTATLSWSDDVRAIYFGTSRTEQALIRDASGTTTLATLYTYTAPQGTSNTGWTSHSVDVSAFAGQTVQVAFVETIPENFTGPARFAIDDVRLLATASAAPASSEQGGNRAGYCSAPGDTAPDGTPIAPGTFLNLLAGQPETDAHYTGAALAAYVEGVGITCDAPPSGYVRQGSRDDYPYYVKP